MKKERRPIKTVAVALTKTLYRTHEYSRLDMEVVFHWNKLNMQSYSDSSVIKQALIERFEKHHVDENLKRTLKKLAHILDIKKYECIPLNKNKLKEK